MADRKKNVPGNKTNKVGFIGIGIAVLLIIIILIVKGAAGSGSDAASKGGDITITKSEVTEKAQFIPYKAGKTKMEVIAIKAPDGSIRTAFNTCQVCFNSGRGYYVQEGDELVCQNCGNRFKADQVEVMAGGCNPVPILPEYKTDDGTTITIPGEFLEQNKELFAKWKK
jgi:uncharacterized membrane protein